jgi:hypothetical protein
VARHLGLFEVVIASDRTRNQAGAAKLTAIREVVRGGAFDYMGDKRADLPRRCVEAGIHADAGAWIGRRLIR